MLAGGGLCVVIGEGADANAFFVCLLAEFFVGKGGVDFQDEMEAGVFFGDGGDGGQFAFADGLEQCVAAAAVGVAHAVDVLFKGAVADVLCKHQLFQGRNGAGVEGKFLLVLLGKALGQHHVADSRRRCKSLGECVDVDDLIGYVNVLQRGDRATGHAEFAIVVVFYDVAVAGFGGPAQQFVTAAYRHHNTCGIMMTGGDVNDVGAGFFQLVDDDSGVVQRNEIASDIHLAVDF